jgi:C-terminal processing protease CtpA/Prc
MYDATGTPLEGRGVVPDDVVDFTKADIVAKRDPQLAAALAYACDRPGGCP